MNKRNSVSLWVFYGVILGSILGACSSSIDKDAQAPLSAPLADPVSFSTIETALENGDLVAAKSLLEQAALATQTGPQYQLLLAEFHLANGDTAMAGAEFTRLQNNDEISARAYQGLGLSLIQSGKFAPAKEALNNATRINPSLWRAWNALGVVNDRAGDYEAALEAYDRAYALHPDHPEIINNMGFSHLLNGEPDQAIALFSNALKLRPTLNVARTNLRLAMALRGDYIAALAGASADELRSLLNNAGVAALARGDFVNAEALLTRAMEKSPSFYALAAKNLEMLNTLKTMYETQ